MNEEYLYNMNDTMKMLGSMTITDFTTNEQVKEVIQAYQKENEKNSLYNVMMKYYIPMLADMYNLGKLNSSKKNKY